MSDQTHPDATREYFDTVADQWDEMCRTFFADGVRQAVIRAANIGSLTVVADVGTGTGFLAEAALAAGARVIGSALVFDEQSARAKVPREPDEIVLVKIMTNMAVSMNASHESSYKNVDYSGSRRD